MKDQSSVRTVTIKVDMEPLLKAVAEFREMLPRIRLFAAEHPINGIVNRLIDCLSSRRFYSQSKAVPASRTVHNVVYVPSGEFVEHMRALRVWALEG